MDFSYFYELQFGGDEWSSFQEGPSPDSSGNQNPTPPGGDPQGSIIPTTEQSENDNNQTENNPFPESDTWSKTSLQGNYE